MQNIEAELSRLYAHADWYLRLPDSIYNNVVQSAIGKPEEFWLRKKAIIEFTAAQMLAGEIALGSEGPEFTARNDGRRKPVDTIVIHHTSTSPEVSLEYLDALQMYRNYLREYRNPERVYYGLPLWSGHFYQGRQTFIGYHYLLWPDGRLVQVLKDEWVGWHAGHFQTNLSSIGIAVVDDLTEKEPSDPVIARLREVISRYPGAEVLGHREVLSTTVCPGNRFLGPEGWKQKIV